MSLWRCWRGTRTRSSVWHGPRRAPSWPPAAATRACGCGKVRWTMRLGGSRPYSTVPVCACAYVYVQMRLCVNHALCVCVLFLPLPRVNASVSCVSLALLGRTRLTVVMREHAQWRPIMSLSVPRSCSSTHKTSRLSRGILSRRCVLGLWVREREREKRRQWSCIACIQRSCESSPRHCVYPCACMPLWVRLFVTSSACVCVCVC
jgi:hypothetical protein